MSEQTPSGGPGRGRSGPGSDFGRRVAARRQQLGLSREEVAARAGAAAGYLRYVEEHPPVPDVAFPLRVAGALETTVNELCGGSVDLPPGIGKAAYHPEWMELDPDECRALLSSHGVGRISVRTAEGPAIFPVNYSLVDDAIVYRTAQGAGPALAAGQQVAFEVDHIDEAMSQGWSVLAVGRAEQVTDSEAVRRLAGEAYSEPWAGDERDTWIRIAPETITGRGICVR